MSTIIPKLGLHDINDDGMSEYAQDKQVKITASGHFGAVKPDTAAVNAKILEWNAALVKSDDGTKADTSDKDDKRKELEALLTQQADNCAEIAAGNMTIYLTSGYEAKNVEGTPVGILEQVQNLSLDYGDNDGQLKANWDVTEHADNYTAQVYTDSQNPSGSKIGDDVIAKKSKVVLQNLPGGAMVWVRVRANGGSEGKGPWSDPATKRVP